MINQWLDLLREPSVLYVYICSVSDVLKFQTNFLFIPIQRITFAKKDSDVIAKMKGTFVPRPKKLFVNDHVIKKKKSTKSVNYSFKFTIYLKFKFQFYHCVNGCFVIN